MAVLVGTFVQKRYFLAPPDIAVADVAKIGSLSPIRLNSPHPRR